MKIALIIASTLLVAGLILGVVGLVLNGFDFEEMNTMRSIENTHVVSDTFSHIAIESSVAKIEIRPATDGICRVDCKEKDRHYFSVTVVDDTLRINLVKDMKWYHYIGINIDNLSATVYLPENMYAQLSIKSTTGKAIVASGLTFDSATIENNTGSLYFSGNVTNALTAKVGTGTLEFADATIGGDLTLSSSTGTQRLGNVSVGGALHTKTSSGNVEMNTVTCNTLNIKYESSNATLTDVVATGHAEIKGSTGSLRFERMGAASMKATTSTGSIKGSLRNQMIVYATSSTGSINVPRGTQGGLCELETSTGRINITIE